MKAAEEKKMEKEFEKEFKKSEEAPKSEMVKSEPLTAEEKAQAIACGKNPQGMVDAMVPKIDPAKLRSHKPNPPPKK